MIKSSETTNYLLSELNELFKLIWQQKKMLSHCKKKYFQDLLSQHFFFFCQINLNNLFSSDNLLFW